MYKASDMSIWSGRNDALEGASGSRWHQHIVPWSEGLPSGIALFGFPCDQGVERNQGRVGARHGPQAIRRALAGQAWHLNQPIYDAGDIHCADCDLESAQQQLGDCVTRLLEERQLPIVMGGGHEVAFGSWQGLFRFAQTQLHMPSIGIINLDAHFDLRAYESQGSSGTPFKQIADQCDHHQVPFNYACFGVSQGANTQALFQRADSLGVCYRTDEQMGLLQLDAIRQQLANFMSMCDWLYFTIDLDVLPAANAPGVSAPASRGVVLEVVEVLVEDIKASGKLKIADIAELNPLLDIDQRTARLAARLINQIAR